MNTPQTPKEIVDTISQEFDGMRAQLQSLKNKYPSAVEYGYCEGRGW